MHFGQFRNSWTFSEGHIISYYLELDCYDIHIVYTYSGEEITGMKTYLEYADAATAQKAFDAMKESGEEMGDAKVDGKYIVATNEASTYEGMTTEDVKQQIQAIELLQNIKDNSNDENEDEVEETEESENE